MFEEFVDAQEVECAAIGNPDDPSTVATTWVPWAVKKCRTDAAMRAIPKKLPIKIQSFLCFIVNVPVHSFLVPVTIRRLI